MSESLPENGARQCRRPAAARRKHSKAPKFRSLLRLVGDDTAALRGFQTGSERELKCGRNSSPREYVIQVDRRQDGDKVRCRGVVRFKIWRGYGKKHLWCRAFPQINPAQARPITSLLAMNGPAQAGWGRREACCILEVFDRTKSSRQGSRGHRQPVGSARIGRRKHFPAALKWPRGWLGQPAAEIPCDASVPFQGVTPVLLFPNRAPGGKPFADDSCGANADNPRANPG